MRDSITVTLEEYTQEAFGTRAPDEHIVLQVSKQGYPITEPHYGRLGRTKKDVYVGVSTVYAESDEPLKLNRRKESFAGMYMLVIDDVGTKCQAEDLPELMRSPTAIVETSPGNHQYHYFLAEPIHNLEDASWFIQAMYNSGPWDSGGANAVKLVRPPAGRNTKDCYDLPRVECTYWDPSRRFSVEDLLEYADAGTWEPGEREHRGTERASIKVDGDDRVLQWLSDAGHVAQVNSPWVVLTRCPWSESHTGADPSGAAYMPGTDRVFKCHHDACAGHGIEDFLAWVSDQGGPSADPIEVPDLAGMHIPGMPEASDGPKDFYQFCDQMPKVKKANLPDVQMTAQGFPKAVQLPTTRNLVKILESMSMAARYNLMTGDAELVPPAWVQSGWWAGLMLEARNTATRNAYKDQCLVAGIGSEGAIYQALADLAIQNPYHPVEDWILSAEWDGVDRFEQLFNTITLTNQDDERTVRMYLDKWLRQVVECVRGYDRRVMKDMVLTFVGPQGCGKTTWIERLMPEGWVSTGVTLALGGGATAERDTIRKATRSPITELGEVDATFKQSAVSNFKSFVSAVEDVYRMSYARAEVTRPRCTAYAGSVNSDRFLVDATGNRRFLVVPVNALDGFHGIDLQQLWAQMNVRWMDNPVYHMTREQTEKQHAMNERFMAPSSAKEAVEYYFNPLYVGGSSAPTVEVVMNASAVAKLLHLGGHPKTLSELSDVLHVNFGPRRSKVKGIRNCWVLKIRHEDLDGHQLAEKVTGATLSLVPNLPPND